MSDSDSDYSDLGRVNSNKGYTVAPSDSKFKLKIKPSKRKKFRLEYTLLQGQTLPYSPKLDGIIHSQMIINVMNFF